MITLWFRVFESPVKAHWRTDAGEQVREVRTIEEVRDLCRELGEVRLLTSALVGQGVQFARPQARELCKQILAEEARVSGGHSRPGDDRLWEAFNEI